MRGGHFKKRAVAGHYRPAEDNRPSTAPFDSGNPPPRAETVRPSPRASRKATRLPPTVADADARATIAADPALDAPRRRLFARKVRGRLDQFLVPVKVCCTIFNVASYPRDGHLTSRTRAGLVAALAGITLACLAAGPAAADTATAHPRTHARSAPSLIGSKVVRAAVRTEDLGAAIPRTGLTEITPAETRLFQDLRKLLTDRTLRYGTTAVYITDATTGEPIYAVHEDDGLNPASNVKLISTAASLDVLGPDWRYRTRVFGPTPDRDGVAHGDLYVYGSYDPTLAVTHLDGLAAALAESGIHRVDGDVLIGGNADRDGVAHSTLKIRVDGAAPGEPPAVTIEPDLGMTDVVVDAVTHKKGRSRLHVKIENITDPLGHERAVIRVSGYIRAKRHRMYWRRVGNRALFTAYALRAALTRAGIEVTGNPRQLEFADYVRAAGDSYLPVELATHSSNTLAAIVRRTNKKSINRLADRVVMTAGAGAYGGEPSMEKGVRLMRAWLQQRADIAPDQVRLDSGSGLSYQTRISARQVVRVLREATGLRGASETDDTSANFDPVTSAYRASLSIAGTDGTLRHRFRGTPIRGHMIGKTGTLTRIIALSGLLTGADGHTLAFSLVTNNHRNGARHRVRKDHERIVEALYRYLRTRAAEPE